jgi:hypothetical protein
MKTSPFNIELLHENLIKAQFPWKEIEGWLLEDGLSLENAITLIVEGLVKDDGGKLYYFTSSDFIQIEQLQYYYSIKVLGDQRLLIPKDGEEAISYQYILLNNGERVDAAQWTLDEEYFGVTLNQDGELQVASEALEGYLWVTGYLEAVNGELLKGSIKVYLKRQQEIVVNPDILFFIIEGADKITIPVMAGEISEAIYLAKDMEGNTLQNIRWSLLEPVEGVSVDQTSGRLIVDHTALGSFFTLVAELFDDEDNFVNMSQKNVELEINEGREIALPKRDESDYEDDDDEQVDIKSDDGKDNNVNDGEEDYVEQGDGENPIADDGNNDKGSEEDIIAVPEPEDGEGGM